MTFYDESVGKVAVENGVSDRTKSLSTIAAFVGSTALFSLAPVSLGVVAGIACLTSLSLTTVAVISGADVQTKFDQVFGVLAGSLLSVSIIVAGQVLGLGGAAMAMSVLGLFFMFMMLELISSSIFAAVVCRKLAGYSVPVGVVLNLRTRFFGILGQTF